jgi:hypothetical protein
LVMMRFVVRRTARHRANHHCCDADPLRRGVRGRQSPAKAY